jgi:hypothetical protein
MFYLVDLCCKDLTDLLDREMAEGKWWLQDIKFRMHNHSGKNRN